MYTRLLTPQKHSFFLFGPRGTGKSTWLRETLKPAKTYDLLSTREALRLSADPSLLYDELAALAKNAWVVIDEIQKVPALLNEVHRLIEDKKLNFALSGSSARKLRRGGVNLLAGRAGTRNLFPLVSSEIGADYSLDRALHFGMLPLALTREAPEEFLNAYVETYLDQEIKAEALVKDIGSFARFLEVAARQNGQVTNISNVARDAMVVRQTVHGFFEVLVDTLIGFWLPAWKLKRATKQIVHPKFYFFDPGVVRAINRRVAHPVFAEEAGALLETHILAEVRAYLSYAGRNDVLSFWSSHDGVEVDLFVETPKGFVGIEIKSANVWRNEHSRGLSRLTDEMKRGQFKPIGVYRGKNSVQKFHPVYPVEDFLQRLWQGEII